MLAVPSRSRRRLCSSLDEEGSGVDEDDDDDDEVDRSVLYRGSSITCTFD